jgi:tetratricopeptide (TPR) repeat protein
LEEAIQNLRQAARVETDDPVIRTTLGRVYLENGNAAEGAVQLEKAISLSPPNPTAWVQLDRALGSLGKRNSDWLARFLSAPDEIRTCEEARECLAKLCADLGRYDSALELLATMEFHPNELSHDLRNLWSRVHLEKAVRQAIEGDFPNSVQTIEKALRYPANLHLGKPARRFDAKTLYVAGLICESAGDSNTSRSYFSKAAEEDQPGPNLVKPWSALARSRLGNKADAVAQLEAIESDARLYLEAGFQPDLDPDLREIIRLCERIKAGWEPSLEEVGTSLVAKAHE